MGKPEDIPQDVWDAAVSVAQSDPDHPYVPNIARAILAAKVEERQKCINVVLGFVRYSKQRGGTACNPYADALKIVSALRYVNTAHKNSVEA